MNANQNSGKEDTQPIRINRNFPNRPVETPRFFTLTCPTCGGTLNITNDIERFTCQYCGNEHLVIRSGNVISVRPIVEGLKNVQAGVDKTASELAIKRLTGELNELYYERNYLSNYSPPYKGCVFILSVVLALIVTGALISGDADALIVVLLMSSILVVPVTAYSIYFSKLHAKDTKPKLEKLDRIIQTKEQEMNWHKKIVSL